MKRIYTTYKQFYNAIDLKRYKSSTKVRYVGTYKTFSAEIEYTRKNYDDNIEIDGEEYINKFSKERIAKEIMKKMGA